MLKPSPSRAEAGTRIDKAGGVPKAFGSPPASTDPGYHACTCGLRGMASAFLRRFREQPHPKGRRIRSLFAIAQARNTSAIIAAMTPRGCREPCSVALSGRSALLFWIDLGRTGFRESFVLRDPGHIKGQLS